MPQILRNLDDRERLDWLRLARSENVGPSTFRRLLERFGSAGKALERLPDLARRGGRKLIYRPYPEDVARAELAQLGAIGARAIAWCEPAYPLALRSADGAPPVITVRGQAEHLSNPTKIAIVGARNASANGRRLAQDMARDLATAGLVVVSGMARGIDTAAHQGAFQAQGGGTIAVVAGGIDVLYPPENAALFERLGQEGVIVAEMPTGTEPLARFFPRRNRIIAGLSSAVVVVEAALKSGSLITARFANEQGREIMAVPGSPLDPRCRGSNHLIRQGALLVEDATQVLDALNGITFLNTPLPPDHPVDNQPIESEMEFSSDQARDKILSLLGPSPVEVDELLRQCHCSAPVMGMVLLELDLAGRLERHPGNRVSLLVQVA
ncbi:MAG: DNA-protecting protein DprA [Rhodospirillaceae bacterium]|nr:DNA-protecting protein DprA [Rhodospirillaceae bacterium]